MSFELDLSTILNTTEANAIRRAAGLRILPACGRCGGCGHYSFNQINGTTCFGCNGSGQVAPKANQQAEVLTEARAAVADGRLAAYLEYLAAAKRSKQAGKAVMAAWQATGISAQYDWRKATSAGRDRDISALNKRMCDAYHRVEKAAMAAQFAKRETVAEMTMALDATFAAALVEIAAAEHDLKSYLMLHPAA